MKDKLAGWVFVNLAGGPEYCTVPGDWLEYKFGEMDGDKPMFTAHTLNDGFELWIAYSHGSGWLVHFNKRDARQLAWFILWHWWGKATWFGLKRRIWYWSLRRLNDRNGIHRKAAGE